jgi:hypothetical protein
VADIVFRLAHWSEIETELKQLLENAQVKMENAETDRALWEAKGEVRALRSMLNLPTIITALRS